tara:strand:+ start:76 stop:225 length:150 start_codon:yes stop_codon:yes gene_type:complete
MTTILSAPWRLITILEQVSHDIAIGGIIAADIVSLGHPKIDKQLIYPLI